MKQAIKRVVISGAVFILLAVPVASAHDGHDHESNSRTTTEPKITSKNESSSLLEKREKATTELHTHLETQKAERQMIVTQKKTELKQRLDDSKKRICDNRQAQINKLMTGMNNRRQNTFDRIAQVSEAVQSYYDKHNLSVANYDDLLAAVIAAKAAAVSSMSAQQSVPNFSCDSEHPRADVADFKDKRSDSIEAMKAYRNATKALLKAVKKAADIAKDSTGESAQ